MSAALTTTEIRDYSKYYGTKYGVDPQLVYAIIEVESAFNPNAIGKSHGERGLMQLRPRYFPKASTLSPAQNIEMGTKYLAKLQQQFKRKYGDAWFICYNYGPTACRKRVHLLNTKRKTRYYVKVSEAYERERQRKGNSMRVARCTGQLCQ